MITDNSFVDLPALLITLFSLLIAACGAEPQDSEQSTAGEPYGGEPHAIPGKIEAEHYDRGPAGEAYHDNDEVNRGADYRSGTQVDIEQRSDASNGHGIGWATAGEWLTYTVDIRESGTYTVEFPVASDGEGGTFHLDVGGTDVTGPIRIPDTGGWGHLEMIEKENVELEAGVHVMRLSMDTNGESGGVGDIDHMRFTRVE